MDKEMSQLILFQSMYSQNHHLTDSQCRAAAGSGHDSDSVFVCEYPFHVTVEEGQRLVWVDTQPWQGFYHHSLNLKHCSI